jgi:large subunit ribosomal protein L6
MNYHIKIPSTISIELTTTHLFIKGAFGVEKLGYSPFRISICNNELVISNIDFNNSIQCQTFLSLIQQTFRGVLTGYKQQLQLTGIGYKCKIIENKLEFKLGFSHLIYKTIPFYLKVSCPKPNKIVIKGQNKQKIQEFSCLLQNLRFPEPYKGKGIFYKNQKILRKQGKKV